MLPAIGVKEKRKTTKIGRSIAGVDFRWLSRQYNSLMRDA
jgi:hypothetical protein